MTLDPNTPCDTCALGKVCGTGEDKGAAAEVRNRLIAEISAYAGTPFFCHHARSGEEYDWQNTSSLGPLQFPPNQRRLCAGWKRRIREVYPKETTTCEKPEDTAALRRYQRSLGRAAMAAVDWYVSEKDPALKQKAQNQLQAAIAAVKG